MSPDGHYVAFEFRRQEHEEIYVVESPVAGLVWCPLSLERITGRPIGREMGSGFTSTLTTRDDRFSYGKCHLKVEPRSG